MTNLNKKTLPTTLFKQITNKTRQNKSSAQADNAMDQPAFPASVFQSAT
jgi:hypothetical protein